MYVNLVSNKNINLMMGIEQDEQALIFFSYLVRWKCRHVQTLTVLCIYIQQNTKRIEFSLHEMFVVNSFCLAAIKTVSCSHSFLSILNSLAM